MALRDFWIGVRSAAKLVTPPMIVDSPRLDAGAIERTLRGTTSWLTPRAVAGFDESDFGFLPDAERSRLADLVEQFLAIASTVSPTAPPPDDAVSKALPLFRDLVQWLEFDRFGDAEAYRLGKQIERAIEDYRPAELAELRFNTGRDHSGDPAIWIWIILTAEASENDERFLKAAQDLGDLLDPVARTVAVPLLPLARRTGRARGGLMSLHADLLEQAEQLAGIDTRRLRWTPLSRPKNGDPSLLSHQRPVMPASR